MYNLNKYPVNTYKKNLCICINEMAIPSFNSFKRKYFKYKFEKKSLC